MSEVVKSSDDVIAEVKARLYELSAGYWVERSKVIKCSETWTKTFKKLGLCSVQLVKSSRSYGGTTDNAYCIKVYSEDLCEMALTCHLNKNVQYSFVSPTRLHHWIVDDTKHALVFPDGDNELTFRCAISAAISDMRREPGNIFSVIDLPIQMQPQNRSTVIIDQLPQEVRELCADMDRCIYNEDDIFNDVMAFGNTDAAYNKDYPYVFCNNSSKGYSYIDAEDLGKDQEHNGLQQRYFEFSSSSSDKSPPRITKPESRLAVVHFNPRKLSTSVESIKETPATKRFERIDGNVTPIIPKRSFECIKETPSSQRIVRYADCHKCGEKYLESENRKGKCQGGSTAVKDFIRCVTCLHAPEFVIKHFCSDADGEYGELFKCNADDELNHRKWLTVLLCTPFLPCIWCYPLLRFVHKRCGICGERHEH